MELYYKKENITGYFSKRAYGSQHICLIHSSVSISDHLSMYSTRCPLICSVPLMITLAASPEGFLCAEHCGKTSC